MTSLEKKKYDCAVEVTKRADTFLEYAKGISVAASMYNSGVGSKDFEKELVRIQNKAKKLCDDLSRSLAKWHRINEMKEEC